MNKILNIAALAAFTLVGISCTVGDKFPYGKEVIMMTGTAENTVTKLALEDNPPATVNISVSATGKVANDVVVTLKVGDEDALAAYNASHLSDYVIVPSNCYTTNGNTVTIAKETAVSEAFPITLTDFSFMKSGVKYMIPVTIEKTEGTNLEVIESSRTIHIRLARTISFSSLSMDDTSMYSEFQFADDKGVDLETYTYEIKCYPTNLKHDGEEQLCRLCNFANKTGTSVKKQNMLRFNENGRPWKSLQIVTPSGGDYTTTTLFEEKTWYMLSMVWDGTTYQLYINGEPDATQLNSNEAAHFQRIELGMSWGGFNSKQNFAGRIAEMRVWDYARTQSQIKGSLCGADPASEGLIAYWKFNQSSGTTFTDETGHGYDMDWTKSISEKSDGAGYTSNSGAASHIKWVKDDVNKCTE